MLLFLGVSSQDIVKAHYHHNNQSILVTPMQPGNTQLVLKVKKCDRCEILESRDGNPNPTKFLNPETILIRI